MNKKTRQTVYEKYNGHCAYCGRVLAYKDMQVDHIWPKFGGGGNELENLNPSCRACNFYKGTFTIEQFRDRIQGQIKSLRKVFIFNMAANYGLIHITEKKVKFYFEKVNQIK